MEYFILFEDGTDWGNRLFGLLNTYNFIEQYILNSHSKNT